MSVHIGFTAKNEARFPIELLRRNILFCYCNMDCGNSLFLKLSDNAFNQKNGQSLVLLIRFYDNSCKLADVFLIDQQIK